MITRIESLSGFGSFRDWTCEQDLPEFRRYNLIYGWNGTGKSTVARLLRSFELGEMPVSEDDFDFSITCSGGATLSPSELAKAPLSVRVFSEDFVSDNLSFDGASVSPLLILGTENVDAAAKLGKLNKTLPGLSDDTDVAKEKWDELKTDREKLLSKGAFRIKEALRSGPDRRFYNYERRNLEGSLKDIPVDTKRPNIDVEAEQRRLNTKPKPSIELDRGFDHDDLVGLRHGVGEVLATELLDTAIPSLRSDAAVQDWVSHGLELHAGREDRCLFCQQRMPAERLEELRSHFSHVFTTHIELIDSLDADLKQLGENLTDYCERAGAIQPDRFYDDVDDRWPLATDELVVSSDRFLGVVERCRSSLKTKRSDPFTTVDDPISDGSVDAAVANLEAAFVLVDSALASHQKRTTVLDKVRSAAQREIETHMVWEERSEYLDVEAQISTAKTVSEELGVRLRQTKEEISRLESEVSGRQDACSEINAALARYFGHGMFTVAPSDESESLGLSLLRLGKPAHRLSEGERNGIALVYFLMKLKEEGVSLGETIVVIDDPVSSLDENKAYHAYGSMIDATELALQVFYLTHSFSMFRSLRRRLGWTSAQKKEFGMFMTQRIVDEDGPSSSFGKIDPTLAKYDSEYHFLFVSLCRYINAEEPTASDTYSMPNIGRRVLETFFAFRKPTKGNLSTKVGGCGFDSAKSERIMRFVDFHSHGDTTDRLDTLGPLENLEAQEVARDILALMASVDDAHVQDMKTHV
ncbi:MAG: AAA family ATPase [Candidatus Paceibacterota bacterium]